MTAHLPFDQTIELLRALAEPTRCRLLAVLKSGELTVGEIAAILEQSQPRISRHLKLLSDVAALERFREEQRIYYRLTSHNQAAALVQQVLSHLDERDVVLTTDQARRKTVLNQRAQSAGADWDDVRRAAEATYNDASVVRAVLKEVGEPGFDQLLDIGTGSGSLLKVLGGKARQAVGLDLSTQALRVARAKLHGAGMSHCQFKRGDMYALPFEAHSFDAVSFDQVLSAADKPAQALREAARVLKKGGRLIVVEDQQRLDTTADDSAQQILKRWFERAGMHCQKVKAMKVGKRQLWLGIGTR